MQTIQTNPQNLSYQTGVPMPGTLDEYRLVHDNYATSGSFSAKSMRPVWIAAFVMAVIAAVAIGTGAFSDDDAVAVPKVNTAALGPDRSVPPASSVPATSNMPAATVAPAAMDSPATEPLNPLTKSTESNSMPMAGHGNNHSSESMNPVKAKSSAPAKSAAVSPRRIAPAAATVYEITTPQEATPPAPISPPAPVPPVVIEEKPVVPAPAPRVEPTEPPKT